MHTSLLLPLILIIVFLAGVSLLQEITRKIRFPYVVALLILGFVAQFVVYLFGFDIDFALAPDLIFFVLLPLLLFGSALHINMHHFKLQVKTITFLATFGLLLSIGLVGGLLAWLLHIPFWVALLFGAMISATDPIAVLALFKSVGAPKRLSLVVDGESMFNDATAVLAYRIILGIATGVYAVSTQTLVHSIGTFLYVFVGSIVVGIAFGLFGALVVQRIKNNAFVETTLTVVLALSSFIVPEHYWHLSGVIAVVMAGIVFGNLGESKISGKVVGFIEDFWDYLGMLAVAIVFFFAAFNLDVSIFQFWLRDVAIVIAVVLVARSISVYSSMFFSNNLPFFKDEPNVSLQWQHILNWGGLRGVIPLVLVFTLPETFAYKEQLLLYTLAVLLFSLFVNGLSISWLMSWLGVQQPKLEEQILEEETTLFELQQARHRLAQFPDVSEEKKVVAKLDEKLTKLEEQHRKTLRSLAKFEELQNSLELQALRLERSVANSLFYQDVINEATLFDLKAQFDIQEDAIEYPELFKNRTISEDGLVDTTRSFRRQLRRFKTWTQRYPLLAKVFRVSADQLIIERYMMLKARLIGNQAVIDYLAHVAEAIDGADQAETILADMHTRYLRFMKHNKSELRELTKRYPKQVEQYHQRLIETFV